MENSIYYQITGMMETAFFEQYGDEIEFQNNSDLLGKLYKIDCSVPRRTQGRTSTHRERHSLKIYLIQLSQNKLLRFPLRIKKDEAPDFFILNPDATTTALEQTGAAVEDHQQAMTELEKTPEGTAEVLECVPKGAYKEALRKHGEELSGEGWDGNSMEKEWIDVILSAIDKKTESLNGPHFKIADRYELLIYDDSHVVGMVHIEDALPLLKKAIHEKSNLKSFERNFHSISVIHRSQLLYDVANVGEETSFP